MSKADEQMPLEIWTDINGHATRTQFKGGVKYIRADECDALREQNRVLRDLVVHVEQIEADLHAALNGTRHDPSWIRPIQLSRNERQELYLGCESQLKAIRQSLPAQPAQGGA